ncbi:MAG: Asp/Glu/hydantoin racemase [Butyrivibrio sp.]|nr:Asp/Glu/hydantoin racemase [Butyrivibrio sp.]
MKIGIVYTSTTPELIADVRKQVCTQLGDGVIFHEQQDPSILAEVREAGYVTAPPAARLITMYMNAVSEGCDAILNVCSSVGEVADCAQSAAAYLGVPIIRIDQEMCREAARLGARIGIIATLQTTMEPTIRTVKREARSIGRFPEIIPCLVEGAFGLDQEAFKERMSASAQTIADSVDVIVFAQGSMAYCESFIADRYHKIVLSSPRFGAAALKQALISKGVIRDA